MFACTAYPGDSAFLKNVRSELVYNIRRLRQHPSVATWCGNNEIREALKYWGWAKRYPKEVYEKFWHDYEALFCKLIPETLREEDPLRPYIESSPDTVNWGRHRRWVSAKATTGAYGTAVSPSRSCVSACPAS